MGKEPVSIYIRQWACFTHKTLSLFCSIFLPQHSKPVQLPLEVPDHSPGHLDPPQVIQVKLILHGLGLAPLTELVLLEPDHATSGGVPLFPTPHPEPVEPGGIYPSFLVVEESNPRVNLLDGLVLVDMIWWGGTVVSEPYKLRGGQQVGNH